MALMNSFGPAMRLFRNVWYAVNGSEISWSRSAGKAVR